MDIKGKIIEILEKENYTFTQLAEYLHMTEDGLTLELNNKTLQIRNLEAISKALRVPLYSLFRVEHATFDFKQKPYYINRLWTGDDEQKTANQLSEEINLLKQIIALKEDRLKKLHS
jgi:transcriptional regulator with XRE-family HTH domain